MSGRVDSKPFSKIELDNHSTGIFMGDEYNRAAWSRREQERRLVDLVVIFSVESGVVVFIMDGLHYDGPA